eukprot:m.76833 g.76833  ORF g.76833 m.76833 type:complete len:389 (-) comp12584_c0_seq1:261-1427(-)
MSEDGILTHIAIVSFLVVITVADTVLIALLMWNFNRNSPEGCCTKGTGCTPCKYNGANKEDYAVYINQATGIVYIVISTILLIGQRCLYPRKMEKGRPFTPWYVLIAIGCMNGFGNFCVAVGQVHTRGQAQAILQTFGIPVVIILSWMFLPNKRPSPTAACAAVLIIGGSALCVLIHTSDSSGIHQLWYSVVLYASSQLFFGGEKVYEESTFGKYTVDVIEMFCWTMYTQVMLGWAVYPLQAVPEFGGIDVNDIPALLRDGTLCVAGITSEGRPLCDWTSTVLFFVYCAVDFTQYGFGLFVIQRGGANLMVLATTVSIPLAQAVFSIKPIMLSQYSAYKYTDGIALALTIAGFCMYQFLSPEGKRERTTGKKKREDDDEAYSPLLVSS